MDTFLFLVSCIAFITALVANSRAKKPAQELDRIKSFITTVSERLAHIEKQLGISMPQTQPEPAISEQTTAEMPHQEEDFAQTCEFAVPMESITVPETCPEPVELPVPEPEQMPVAEQTPEPILEPVAPLPPAKPNAVVKFIKDFFTTGNVVAKIGIALLILGVTFLVKYSADRGWFPIELRLIGMSLLGLALTVIGWKLRLKNRMYALILQGGGLSIFYITIFASFRIFALVDSLVAFGMLFVATVFLCILAIGQDALTLAVIGIAGGFLAPILTSTGSGNYIALFTYYTILNVGIFFIAWFKPWRMLNILGFNFTFAIGSLWGVKSYQPEFFATTEPFLIIFFLFYVSNSILYAIKKKTNLKGVVDGTLVFGTPLIVFSLQYGLVHNMPHGMVWSAFALSIFYLGLVFLLLKRLPREIFTDLMESFLAIGVIFLTVTIPLAFNAQWTSAFWALKGAGLVWIGTRQNRVLARLFGSLLILSSGFLIYKFIGHSTQIPTPEDLFMLNGTWLGCFVKTTAALLTVYFLGKHQEKLRWHEAFLAPVLAFFGLVWWYFGAAFDLDRLLSGTTYSVVSFAFFGVSYAATWVLSKKLQLHFFREMSLAFWFIASTLLLIESNLWLALLWAIVGFFEIFSSTRSAYEPSKYYGFVLLFLSAFLCHDKQDHRLIANMRFLAASVTAVLSVAGATLLQKASLKKSSTVLGFILTLTGLCVWFVEGGREITEHFSGRHLHIITVLFLLGTYAVSWLLNKRFRLVGFKEQTLAGLCITSLAILAHDAHLWVGFLWALFGFMEIQRWKRENSESSKCYGFVLLLVASTLCHDQLLYRFLLNFRDVTAITTATLSLIAAWQMHKASPRETSRVFGFVLMATGLGVWLINGVHEVMDHQTGTLAHNISILFIILSLCLCEIGRTRICWPELKWPNWVFLPYSFAFFGILGNPPLFQLGWLVWPLLFVHHYWFLNRQDTTNTEKTTYLKFLHAVVFWQLVTFVTLAATMHAKIIIGNLVPWNEYPLSWNTVLPGLFPALLVLFVLTQYKRVSWPLNKNATVYLTAAILPVIIYLVGWSVVTNLKDPVNTVPLPYLPIINPIDITMTLIYLPLIFWLRLNKREGLIAFSDELFRKLAVVVALLIFFWFNAILTRTIHHYAGVPFRGEDLYHSLLVQTSISIYWCLIAMGCMIFASRKGYRKVWIGGAILLGIVVLKLFFVDLSNKQTLARIISFIVVGLLFLVTGYFSPLPPQKASK